MKTRAMVMAAVMAVAVMASTRVASAQDKLIVNVPFDFAAGNVKLPAGEYSITRSTNAVALLLINRENPKASIVVTPNAAEAGKIQTQSKLVFNRYGDEYFLSQIWTEGSSRGKQFVKTDREKEMTLLAKNETPERVTLVASLGH
jgi:hypothetical protein